MIGWSAGSASKRQEFGLARIVQQHRSTANNHKQPCTEINERLMSPPGAGGTGKEHFQDPLNVYARRL